MSDKLFFGSITFNFEFGKLVHIVKKQNIKPTKGKTLEDENVI